jgi:hypothetical protein
MTIRGIREYEQKYNREERNNFASACYNDNSVDELLDALVPDVQADETDCKEWGISAEEWRDAISAACEEKIHDSCYPRETE